MDQKATPVNGRICRKRIPKITDYGTVNLHDTSVTGEIVDLGYYFLTDNKRARVLLYEGQAVPNASCRIQEMPFLLLAF